MICGFVGLGFMLGALDQITRLMPDNEDLWSYRPRVGTEIYSTEVNPDGTEIDNAIVDITERRGDILGFLDGEQAFLEGELVGRELGHGVTPRVAAATPGRSDGRP